MATKESILKMQATWNKEARKWLRGRKIVDARYPTVEEAKEHFEDWYGNVGLILWLDDGTTVMFQQDDEGNGPGAAYVSNKEESEVLPTMQIF